MINPISQDNIFTNDSRKTSSTALTQMSSPSTPDIQQALTANPLTSNPLPSNPLPSNPLPSNPLASNPLPSNPLASNPLTSNPLTSNPLTSRLEIPDQPKQVKR
jgi:hypothetical protein